jgi:autotransporter-associated beta strand protein
VVPTSADDVLIGRIGDYAVRLSSAASANSLVFDAPGARFLESAGGALTLGGDLTVSSGMVELNGANSIGGKVDLHGGLLSVGGAGALGDAMLLIDGGELLGAADLTLANRLGLSGYVTIAAAPGATLDLAPVAAWAITADATVQFGAPGQDGVVVWGGLGIIDDLGSNSQRVRVAGGVLQPGDTGLSLLLDNAHQTTVEAGAVIDLAGIDLAIRNLRPAGGGITNSGTHANLILDDANFSGTISGALSLEVRSGVTGLSGVCDYTGTTTIDSGAWLNITAGEGAAPLAKGDVVDDGSLFFYGGDLTIRSLISGSGSVSVRNEGVVTVNRANTFTGDFTLQNGELRLGAGGALGSGRVSLTGSSLVATGSQTLSNQLVLADAWVSAAHGKTLILSGGVGFVADGGIVFGSVVGRRDGAVVWHTPAGSAVGGDLAVEVAAGTLRAGDADLGVLLGGAQSVSLDAGAWVDMAGYGVDITGLNGAGRIMDSGGPAALRCLGAGDFAGAITGDISLEVGAGSHLTLEATNTYTGTTTIGYRARLTLAGAGSTGAGLISIEGQLEIARGDTIVLSNPLTGSGFLAQDGPGTTLLTGVNALAGGTEISGGALAVRSAQALGAGVVDIDGGELRLLDDVTISQGLDLRAGTIAVRHGRTALIDSGDVFLQSGALVAFGGAGEDGVIVWNAAAPSVTDPGTQTLVVEAGVLRAGGPGLSALLENGALRITAGAKVDMAGFAVTARELWGAGAIVNSGDEALLKISDGFFDTAITGAIGLEFGGESHPGGLIHVTGDTIIDAGVMVYNGGDFVLGPNAGLGGGGGSAFVNEGLFEKVSGHAFGIVLTPFENDGEVIVASGGLSFGLGFVNVGIVRGVLAGSGNAWTITANAPGEATWFGGTGDNHFVLSEAPTYVDGGGGVDNAELTADMVLAAGSLVSVEGLTVDDGVAADVSALSVGFQAVLASTAGGGAPLLGSQAGDRIVGGAGDDRAAGGGGADHLWGGDGRDTLLGSAGADMLDGGARADVLTGGAGRDSFAFTTALGAANIDTVVDFSVADDTIRLENAVFQTLATGPLAPGAFHVGAAAHDGNDHVIYNAYTGALYYDPDGTGAAAQVRFADLTAGLALTSHDFLVT